MPRSLNRKMNVEPAARTGNRNDPHSMTTTTGKETMKSTVYFSSFKGLPALHRRNSLASWADFPNAHVPHSPPTTTPPWHDADRTAAQRPGKGLPDGAVDALLALVYVAACAGLGWAGALWL
jgi:hypothetical protein